MKINYQDIIRTARQLRDEENEQLHVTPWHRQRHFRLPSWLVAIPAAAFVGFLLGIWYNGTAQGNMPLTAIADTVYIKVTEPLAHTDTATLVAPQPVAVKAVSLSNENGIRNPSTDSADSAGRPIANDEIRYDLLVKN